MAYETKVILMSLAGQIAFAKTAKQAYEMVRVVAQVEGVAIPDIDSYRAMLAESESESEEDKE